MEVACFVTRVKDHRVRVKVHATDGEKYGLLAFNDLVGKVFTNLLFLVVEYLAAQELVLERAWHGSVKVQVAIHVS